MFKCITRIIKIYNFYKYKKIRNVCKKYHLEKFTIRDGLVNVYSDVYLKKFRFR